MGIESKIQEENKLLLEISKIDIFEQEYVLCPEHPDEPADKIYTRLWNSCSDAEQGISNGRRALKCGKIFSVREIIDGYSQEYKS